MRDLLGLVRAGMVLARAGFFGFLKIDDLPLRAQGPFRLARMLEPRGLTPPERGRRICDALSRLGPSYIKLGQFLATRADVIGPELARDLGHLHDRLPPFSEREARRAIEEELGGRLEDHFVEFGPPVAAASIAQVHKAVVLDTGERRTVAVKILRPGVERRFARDLDSYYFAAGIIERFHPPSRRLRPVAVVDNLKRTTELEMDLRLEAAAISEMADNIKSDEGFRVPNVDWRRTQRRVLTLEWIDGLPLSNPEALRSGGHDLEAIGLTVLQSFLRHAMRDGFFHADMHHGNLLVDPAGCVVAVDFGIMGRLGMRERRFLAEILHGLITRNYRRAAEVHFWAGYVPAHHSVETFAQAMRAIGEPIHGRSSDEISMAGLLGQLFAYTDVFDMETRPELILLQKTMVVVEGVARSLHPSLNIWTAAEPIAQQWIEENYGVTGRLREAGAGAEAIGKLLSDAPRLLESAERAGTALAAMAENGLRLDRSSIDQLAAEEARRTSPGRWALWIGALSLLALAIMELRKLV